jgi:hypothetical protein
MPWLVCVFVSFIIVDLQLAIYCDAPGYKARTYDTEELVMDRKKKQLSGQLIFDNSVKRIWAIRRSHSLRVGWRNLVHVSLIFAIIVSFLLFNLLWFLSFMYFISKNFWFTIHVWFMWIHGFVLCVLYHSWSSISDILWRSWVPYKARTYDTEELVMDRNKKAAFRATYFWQFRQKTLGDKEITLATRGLEEPCASFPDFCDNRQFPVI